MIAFVRLLLLGTAPIASILVLAGCQTMGSGAIKPAVSNACLAFKPIYWSKADTLDTQKQATAHNAAWKSLCGAKP